MSTILEKIKSIKLCLMAHPDYEYGSEFEYRISDLEEIENECRFMDGFRWRSCLCF
jgi:hypothetical protein